MSSQLDLLNGIQNKIISPELREEIEKMKGEMIVEDILNRIDTLERKVRRLEQSTKAEGFRF